MYDKSGNAVDLQSRLMEILIKCDESDTGDKALFSMMIHELGHWLHDATKGSKGLICITKKATQ